MNTKKFVIRTTTLFAGLALAGITVAGIAQIIPDIFAQMLMVAIGSTIFGSGLTFFLIRMSNLENNLWRLIMTTITTSQFVSHEVKLNEQYSIGKLLALHLLPGMAGILAYILLAPIFMNNGYPAVLGLLVAAGLVILPIELVILLYQARRASGTFSLKRILPYHNPLPKWQYVVIPVALVLWGFLATLVTSLLDSAIANAWFAWLPEWFFFFDLSQYEGYAQPALMLTFIVYLIVNGIALPIVEELYFRGYLLPRLEHYGKWAPLINLSLFSLYHFWTPWGTISRILWMFPWVYVAWRKQNIYLIMIAHCTANIIGSLLTWGLILGH